MQLSANGAKLIQLFEQLKLAPYLDSAHIWTVGWGHALTTAGGQLIDADIFGAAKAEQLAVEAMQHKFGRQTITREEADALFIADKQGFVNALAKELPADTTQAQFDALVSFSFNLGVHNFDTSAVKRFHLAGHREVGTISMKDLNARSRAHENPDGVALAFARWDNANGHYSLGVFRRRIAELLVYSGWDAQKAYDTAYSYKD